MIRFRGGAQNLAKTERGGPVRTSVPLDLNKRVVYIVKLNRLDAGDVVVATVDARAHVGHLPFAALVGSQLVLAEGPQEEHGRQFAKRMASLGGRVHREQWHQWHAGKDSRPVHRTGVLTIRKDVRRQAASLARCGSTWSFAAPRSGPRAGPEMRFRSRTGPGCESDGTPPTDERAAYRSSPLRSSEGETAPLRSAFSASFRRFWF